MNTILFEDTLDIRQLNVDGKKFERVNRLHCKSNDYDVDVVLGTTLAYLFSIFKMNRVDVNCELFDVRSGDVVKLVLAR